MSAGDTTSEPTRVILNGMPGSGKSTVGAALARLLGFRFEDLDTATERLAGRPTSALFAEGEATFRAAERRALEAVLADEHVVIAAGGGALVTDESLALAREAGPVVYLRATLAELEERLAGGRGRPLLLDAAGDALTGGALRARLAALLAEREPAYRLSHHVVDIRGRPAGEIARQVADLVRGRG